MTLKKIIIISFIFLLSFIFPMTNSFAESVIDMNVENNVLFVQSAINIAGYDISIDGIFGEETKLALQQLQKDNGFLITGEVDDNTYNYLTSIQDTEISRGIRKINVITTGYSRFDYGCGNITATGSFLQKGIIAVDPDYIPLGTRVLIPGYGIAIAEDTGGAIEGNIIDLAFDSHEEALLWGRQYKTIYIY